MGILGLTGFIDRNTHLLHRHELKECSVVIDGNNLFHHVYRSCRILSTFGGDYDVYHQQIVTNLKSLLKCGIKPYVVLDGGYTTDNRKFRKCIDRAKQRIGNVRQAAKRGFCQLTPLLAYDTFLQTLNELKIAHATCQFEADSEIVKLANRLKCPVISNDSDFYIFDLTHGFLPMDYMDFNPLYKRNPDGSKSQPFLHCQKYHVDDFINSFEGLNRSVLPVFASLLGNDFVPTAAGKKVYSKVQVPKVVSKQCYLPARLKKVMKLLHWLEMHSDCSSSILDQILPHVTSKKKFLSSVEGYFDVVKFEGCDLFNFFSSEENFEPVAAATFKGYNGAEFPAWFLSSICRGEITPVIINSAVLHRLIFLCQSEHLPSPSSYYCCEFVRRVIYGILINSDPVGKKGAVQSKENCADSSELLQAVMGEDRNEHENDVAYRMLHCEITDKDVICDTKTDKLIDASKNEIKTDELIDASENEIKTDELIDASENEIKTDELIDASENEIKTDELIDASENEIKTDELSDASENEIKTDELSDASENEIKTDKRVNSNGHEEEDDDDDDDDDDDIVSDSCVDIEEEDTKDESIVVHPSVLKQTSFEEYLRERGRLKKCYLEPVLSIGGQNLPSLSEIGHLPVEKKLSILLNTLEVDISFINTFPAEFSLYPACLRMWLQNADPPVTEYHLDCAVLCPILLHMQRAGKTQQSKKIKTVPGDSGQIAGTFIDIEKVCEESRKTQTDKFKKVLINLDKYQKGRPIFSRKNQYDPEIPHAFSQLQSCMFEVCNLNKLLRCPLPILRAASLMNGTFLYNFYSDLVSRPTPSAFIEAMLFKGFDIHNLFLRFKSAVVNATPNAHFASLGENVVKRRKRNKGRKKRKASPCEQMEEEEQKSSVEDENEEEIMTISGFDIHNKFSLLS